MFELPQVNEEVVDLDLIPNDSLFLIISSDPWYGGILLYLQTQQFWYELSHNEH